MKINHKDKRELYYNFLEELRKEMTRLNGMIQEEYRAEREIKKARRELEKKYAACEQKFTSAPPKTRRRNLVEDRKIRP
jgi:hypothetical protein